VSLPGFEPFSSASAMEDVFKRALEKSRAELKDSPASLKFVEDMLLVVKKEIAYEVSKIPQPLANSSSSSDSGLHSSSILHESRQRTDSGKLALQNSRQWNMRFQEILEIEHDSVEKYKKLKTLAHDFVYTAVNYAKVRDSSCYLTLLRSSYPSFVFLLKGNLSDLVMWEVLLVDISLFAKGYYLSSLWIVSFLLRMRLHFGCMVVRIHQTIMLPNLEDTNGVDCVVYNL
jgi:hypothetical protein